MTTTLRDALAAAHINRMKARAEMAWQRQRREAEPSECTCFACQIRRGLVAGVRLSTEADDQPAAPVSKLN